MHIACMNANDIAAQRRESWRKVVSYPSMQIRLTAVLPLHPTSLSTSYKAGVIDDTPMQGGFKVERLCERYLCYVRIASLDHRYRLLSATPSELILNPF